MRPLTTEDYWEIWGRRRWWFLGMLFLTAAGTCLVSALLPKQYTSECLILLEGQTPSVNSAKQTPEQDESHQLAELVQETLSRSRLKSVIQEFELAGPGTPTITDEMVDDLRKRINVQIIREESPGRRDAPYGFKISFTGAPPRVAQQLDNELASFFVSEKLKTVERTAQQTLEFLHTQLDLAAKDLQEKQQRQAEYKRRYSGQLPIDEQLNVQTLARLQTQLQSNEQALERARQEKSMLDSFESVATEPAGTAGGGGNTLLKLHSDLDSLKSHQVDLQSRYTLSHPDIIKTKEQVTQLQAEIDKEEAADKAKAPAAIAKSTTKRNQPNGISDQAQEIHSTIAALEQEQKRLNDQLLRLQGNLQAIPLRQQQYDELQRAYENSKAAYDQVGAKLAETQLASDVDQRLQGRRFRIQDFASLPDQPSWPVLWKINLGGLAAGLLLALGLVALMELRDCSMHSDRDVEYYLRLKNLAIIPELESPAEIQQVQRQKVIRVFASSSLVLAVSALLGYIYFVRK